MITAIYARKSTDQTGLPEEAKSVARQIEHATAFAAKKGWRVAPEHIYVDDGISGAEFARRPGLMRLLSALTPHPPFQVLIMSTVDRLGREQIETAYLLKQIIRAGVRVFDYLEDRERVLDSPTDKLLLSVTTYAAEMERHQARQRTRDALLSRGRKGYVTGGSVFGYDNVDVLGDTGKRQHVERRINPAEAPIVRRLFHMAAEGLGFKRAAKTLNAERVPAPRPRRRGRPQAWTPSSIRWIIFNPLYTGRIVWGRTKKRDAWGQKKQSRRPPQEWLELPPRDDLRIVSNDVWRAAHERIAVKRATYTQLGRCGGRPAGGAESPYLLTGFAECAQCRGSLVTGSRASGSRRQRAYVCAHHRERGNTICANRLPAPMDETDRAVLDAIGRDLLRDDLLKDALEEAVRILQPSEGETAHRRGALETELRQVDAELSRYAEAIATAGALDAIVTAMKERELRRTRLRSELANFDGQAKVAALDTAHLMGNLRERLADWQGLLRRQTPAARQLLRTLLVGRLSFTPHQDPTGRYYEFVGQGSISPLITGVVLPKGSWPQRDSNPCFQAGRGWRSSPTGTRTPSVGRFHNRNRRSCEPLGAATPSQRGAAGRDSRADGIGSSRKCDGAARCRCIVAGRH